MERALTLGTVVITGAIIAKIIFNLVFNPLDARRVELADELAQVAVHGSVAAAPEHDFAVLQNTIAARPSLWREIVASAAAPAKETVAAPSAAPDVAGMLKDLRMAPGQIGEEWMQVIAPAAPDGDWMKVGDSYNGCTLVSFTREEAVFSYWWEAEKREITVALERPLR